MKRIFILAVLFILAAPGYAQHNPRHKPPKAEELITTLTPRQKRQLEAIDKEQRTQANAIKKELKQVRDSVHAYIDLYGDNTKVVNRLLEREAALQLKLNKLLYSTKVKIDRIITPEQHKEMHRKMAQSKSRRKDGNK